jgi:GNAT superfamily N-acetyltransferase
MTLAFDPSTFESSILDDRGSRALTISPPEQQLRAAHAWSGDTADRLRIVTFDQRPDLIDAVPGVLASRWPAFMLAGEPGHNVDMLGLLTAAPQHQILLLDDNDAVLGVGLSVPLTWDRTVDGLPAGWDGVVSAGAQLLDSGGRANAVSALSITLRPEATGRGLASRMIGALKAAAAGAGIEAMIAPVRPILKSQYPLTPMAQYLGWRTADDQAFDPWLRLHLRLGGVQVGIAYPSMTIRGTVAQWQEWTDLQLPAAGEFVIPGGLVPLTVDRRADLATYREPNVWFVHRTAG